MVDELKEDKASGDEMPRGFCNGFSQHPGGSAGYRAQASDPAENLDLFLAVAEPP
jgi:hypothetical protein